MTLDEAVALATEAHAGQTDKAGHPYIEHPLRVMGLLTDPYQRIAGVLHDVVEDTAMTLDDLRQRGCPEAVLDAVDALTRRADETPAEYYVRVAADPIAIAVKRADIADNSDPSRLAAPPAGMALRLREKYEKAAAILGPGD